MIAFLKNNSSAQLTHHGIYHVHGTVLFGRPIVVASDLNFQMPDIYFSSCTFYCHDRCGGYIINDYFDIKIDRVNKPDDVVVDKGIKKACGNGCAYGDQCY